MTTFGPCVKTILCGLSNAVLASLRQLITATLLPVIQAEQAALTALSLAASIAVAPAQAALTLLQIPLDQARSITQLVPTRIMEGCVDFGEIMTDVDSMLVGAFAGIEDLQTDIARQVAKIKEYEARLAELTDLETRLNALVDLIRICESEP